MSSRSSELTEAGQVFVHSLIEASPSKFLLRNQRQRQPTATRPSRGRLLSRWLLWVDVALTWCGDLLWPRAALCGRSTGAEQANSITVWGQVKQTYNKISGNSDTESWFWPWPMCTDLLITREEPTPQQTKENTEVGGGLLVTKCNNSDIYKKTVCCCHYVFW